MTWLAEWRVRRLWAHMTPAQRAAMAYAIGRQFIDQAGVIRAHLADPAVQLDTFSSDFYLAVSCHEFGSNLQRAADLLVDQMPEAPVSVSKLSEQQAAALAGLLLHWLSEMATDPEATAAIRAQAIKALAGSRLLSMA